MGSSAPSVLELLERLIRMEDVGEACSFLLERAAALTGAQRALMVLGSGAEAQGATWGIAPDRTAPLVRELGAGESPLQELIETHREPNVFPGDQFPSLRFGSCVLLPIRSAPDARAFGGLVLEREQAGALVQELAGLLARAAPALERLLTVARLSATTSRLARQRDLLSTILNALPDPVLLTNDRNDIILANSRAEHLLTPTAEDSDGRRRAVQVNNLLFSSFLTQALIDTVKPNARELNLVDTADGSDLLLEVLSVPRAGSEQELICVLRDITDLKHAVSEMELQYSRLRAAEHYARQERDRLNVILENVSDPILVTDEHSNIILMNPEADRLFVAANSPTSDPLLHQLVQANDTRFTTLISDFMLRPEQRQVVRVVVEDPDAGQAFPAEVASSKILNARGEPIAIVSVVHDLTQAEENERLARELQQLNEELEERVREATLELEERNRQLEWQSFELQKASRLKSEFLANMSHELRTPINVILGYTSLLRERLYGELSAQQEDALAKTYTTSQHLLDLINDILDLSKIEAGKMPLHVEPVPPRVLLAEVAESVQPMVRRKELSFRIDAASDLPVVRTDRTKMKQVLLNLLSNAIKFTHEGGITLSAVARGEGVRLSVADTGIGIRPESLDSIFEDFRQADQSHTREYGGTGLGLSITRKLLALLGGVISCESTFGVGTTFHVDLPLRIHSPADVRGAAASVDA